MIGEGRLRSEQMVELELDRRGRGPEGEPLPRWILRIERIAQPELFEVLVTHLSESTSRALRVGERVGIKAWPASTFRARSRGGFLFMELPQTALAIPADHSHLSAILKLIGGPLGSGEIRSLDMGCASALRRGLISARAQPSFEKTSNDVARNAELERALITAERLSDGSLEINLGVPGQPRRPDHVKVYAHTHAGFQAVEQHLVRCLGATLDVGQNRLIESWPEP